MAVVASATGVALGMTAGTIGAGLVGGAVLGAGAGALYSGITGDGDILNSALTGAFIGGGIGGLGAALAPAAAGGAGLTGASGATGAMGSGSALQLAPTAATSAYGGIGASSVPSLAGSASLTTPGVTAAGGSTGYGALKLPSLASSSLGNLAPTGAGMTGNEMLGYGLAGTAAMSLLGGMNQPKLSTTTGTTPGTIRPYTYSQTKNPNYGQPGESYYNQSYTAQPAYAAAKGGVIRMAAGGLPAIQGNMYPQSQQINTNFATPTQMPTSAEIVASDYDTSINPYTGEPIRMADGGPVDPNMQASFVPASNNPPVQVGLVPPPVVGNKYTIPQKVPSQSVTDYNKLLASRANEEYVKAPPIPNMLPGGKYGTTDLTNQISQKYQDILGRAPDQPGLDYWLKQAQGGTKLSDIQNAFLGSQEYLSANPGAVAPQPVVAAPLPTTGPAQADIDAYLAANPTTVRTYDPKTQKYSAPAVTQAQIDAWKASQVANDPFQDPNFQNFLQNQYTQYQQSLNSGGGKAGGKMPDALKYANGGGIAGAYNLGSYSDGGRLLKGPGDGVSDDIPAVIGDSQPARLADGEFVIPARIVSELGNGSTDAGAKRLYAMMDNIQAGRKKTIGKNNVAKDTKAKKHLLA